MSDKHSPYGFDEIIDRRAVPALKTHPMVLGKHGESLFAAGVADMDFKAPQVVLSALQKRLDHGVFGYEAVPEGLFPALTGWLKVRHGWQVEARHILRAPNILNALAIAVSLFTKEGDRVIIQPPVFFDFFDVITENRRAVISNPLILENGHYAMDFADLEHKAADPCAKMIFLCNPHNPVGRVWRASELQRLGDICKRHNVLVVSDEIHGDLSFSDHKYTPFASLGADYARNCIACISPAKSFNIASCCSAFTIISNENIRKLFAIENSRLTANKNNAFANAAMQAAYTHGGPWLDAVLAYIQDNKSLVAERLKRIPGVTLIEPQGTFLMWLDFRKLNLNTNGLTELLKEEAKWAITRGEAFGAEGEGFARLNIACPRSKLAPALDQLERAICK